jgi:hypothetical protein
VVDREDFDLETAVGCEDFDFEGFVDVGAISETYLFLTLCTYTPGQPRSNISYILCIRCFAPVECSCTKIGSSRSATHRRILSPLVALS